LACSFRRKLRAKFTRRVSRDHFHAQTHRLETQFHFVREFLLQFARAENADAFHRVAQFGGQLAERDARLSRDEVGVQHAPAAFVFNRAFESAQRRHATAAGDLQ